MAVSLKCVSCPDKNLAHTNVVYFSPQDVASLTSTPDFFHVKVAKFVFVGQGHEGVKVGEAAFNSIQRKLCQLALNVAVTCTPFVPPDDGIHINNIIFSVDYPNKGSQKSDSIDAIEVAEHIKKTYHNHCFCADEQVLIDFYGINLILTVEDISVHTLSALVSEQAAAGGEVAKATLGQLIKGSNVTVTKAPGSSVKLSNLQSSTTSTQIFRPDFSFEAMGIGGLDKEFSDIFRRAFASRVFPPAVVNKLGIHHVRGMLLFGPPGCGKTLIARQIGKMLNGREPKVVNGPEILNKYVGQSEENVRKLFAEAEAEMLDRGDESELHIIILDEMDAICKQRGSSTDGTGTHDSIVNQLLSKIDGVNSLNNILLIGMTNRKDMIDEALLRPGRLEVHMEIGLPDTKGRLQILRIHTHKMSSSGYMDADVDLGVLAEETKNFSGAEIEGLTKSAVSFALERQVDASNLAKPINSDDIRVCMVDFKAALAEVQPAFGVATEEFENCRPFGMIATGSRCAHLQQTLRMLVDQVRQSTHTPLMTVLLEGPIGTGKTALAATCATDSEFPFIKMISPENMVGMGELSKVSRIHRTFEDAYKSAFSVVVLDNIERLLEYVRLGHRFSNHVLQALLVLIKKAPPKGRKLLIIGTTSSCSVLESMELLDAFNVALHVPTLNSQELENVLLHDPAISKPDVPKIVEEFGSIEDGVGIKKVLLVAEMAKQNTDVVTYDRFVACMRDCGL